MTPQTINYANFDRIEDYLFGRLTAEDRLIFEQEVAENSQLADELQQQKLEHQAMELMLQADLRKQFQAWDTEGVSPPFFQLKFLKIMGSFYKMTPPF